MDNIPPHSKCKELFWKLFNANGEHEVHKIVSEEPLLNNNDNWFPYGGINDEDRNNLGTFQNQQPEAVASLIEKITNSIDAILLKECKLAGIDPKSDAAPQDMAEAVSRFFNIQKGDLNEITGTERGKFARDHIQLVATGDDKKPDLLFYDNGEGQHPNNFRDTFLSIGRNNKNDIPFVQGQYNMGSTGAVTFCGEYRYQLIASKKCDKIFNDEIKNENEINENEFGYTLVRRRILNEKEREIYRNSWYEYFAINKNWIPRFDINSIDVGISDKEFTTGSLIKLYSYQLSRGTQTAIHARLYRRLNQQLYRPALPFWILDKRYLKEKNSNIITGNFTIIEANRQEAIEKTIRQSQEIKELGKFTVEVIILKIGEDSSKDSTRISDYIGRKHIIYTLNGQVQGAETKASLTEYNLPFLKDRMLVHIDCSDMNINFRQDLFMANRYNLREGDKLNELKRQITEIIKAEKSLIELNNTFKDNLLKGGFSQKEQKLMEDIISNVPLNKELKTLLKQGMDGIIPIKKLTPPKPVPLRPPVALKRFPAIFSIKLKDDSHGKKVKSIPIDNKGIIEFETDVDNDYFLRPQESGELIISVLGTGKGTSNGGSKLTPTKITDYFNVTKSDPNNGLIKIILNPRDNVTVGDEIQLSARLTSPGKDLEVIFYVNIQKNNSPKVDKSNQKEEKNELNLPNMIKIIKEDGEWKVSENGESWTEPKWNEESVVKIIESSDDTGSIDAIAINMNSHALDKYISTEKLKSTKGLDIIKNRYTVQVFFHSLFLFSIFKKKINDFKDSEDKNISIDIVELISKIFEDYASVLLHININEALTKILEE